VARRPRDNRRPSRLVVGLGNPGRRYANTYHNAGFLAVERLAREYGIRLREEGEALVGTGDAEGAVVLLAMPLTYMNRCGLAVAPLVRGYGLTPEDVVAVHDELDLPLGAVRLKRGGGAGGHNGLRSLAEFLGSPDFLRIRVGIGRPPAGTDGADYVLSPVLPPNRGPFEGGVEDAAAAAGQILRDGFDRAMNRWNTKAKEPKENSESPSGRKGDTPLLAPGEATGGSSIRKEDYEAK
jgi:PTH1 family peptidyl-tRNA hydrolase